jgi:hypothetical protein
MDINILAVVLAALSAFFLGFLWYTVIFARPWQQLIGMGEKGKGAGSTNETPDLGRLLIGSLALEVIMAVVLAGFIGKDADLLEGLKIGVTAGAGFVALAFGVNYMFEGKPIKLWLINASYNIVVFAVMGLIIGAL